MVAAHSHHRKSYTRAQCVRWLATLVLLWTCYLSGLLTSGEELLGQAVKFFRNICLRHWLSVNLIKAYWSVPSCMAKPVNCCPNQSYRKKKLQTSCIGSNCNRHGPTLNRSKSQTASTTRQRIPFPARKKFCGNHVCGKIATES